MANPLILAPYPKMVKRTCLGVLFLLLFVPSVNMAADKGQARIYIGQGMLLMERGRLDEAEARFVRALQVDPRNAEANFRIGHAHLLRNNLEKALDYMLQATGFEPENTLYAMNVAQIYERMNNLEEAIKEYERIINVSNEEKVRKTAEKRMTLASGRLMAQKGEVNAALLLFNGLLLEYPEDVKVLQNIALAYLNLKRTEEAEQILKKLERITPNDVQLQMQLANLYEGEGKIDRAVVHLQKFINVQKRGPQVKSTMLRMTMLEGDIAMNKEDWDGAVKIFSRAINLDSRFVKAYFTRGSAYALAGKKKEALKDFDVVLKLDPDNLNVRINISNIYIEQKEFDKAKVLLDYVISNDRSGYFEKSAKARLNYMHTVVADEALKAGNVEESFKEYEKALEFYSGNVKANFNRGLILVNQGKLEEAEKEFLSVIEAMPESTGARINLANIYSSMSRFSEEVEQYRAVVKLDKNSKDGKQASDRLPLAEGRALMADGKIAEAEAMFLEIVKQTRFDVRAFFFLGNISSRRGDLRKAAEYYQKLLNFMPGNHNVRMALAEVYELLGFEELAANEYRGVLFTSRNASLAESAKLRLENVESKLSGFTRTMSYQMVYIDNYNQNDEEPLEEYSSSLSFNVGFVHKFAQEFTMGLRAVPSYSNLHNSGADFLSLNLNGDLRIGNTQRDWFFSLGRNDRQNLLNEVELSSGQSYDVSHGATIRLPALFGLTPDNFANEWIPTKIRSGISYSTSSTLSNVEFETAVTSWNLSAFQQLRGGFGLSGDYSFSANRNLENFQQATSTIDPRTRRRVRVLLYDSRDYETNEHSFSLSLSKVMAAGFRLNWRIGGGVTRHINPDSVHRALNNKLRYRQTVNLNSNLRLDYLFLKDITFGFILSWNRNISDMSAGLTVRDVLASSDTAGDFNTVAGLQSLSLGSYTNKNAVAVMQMNF